MVHILVLDQNIIAVIFKDKLIVLGRYFSFGFSFMCGNDCYAKNFVAEENLMNGSMRTVIDIVDDDPQGSKVIGALPLYVVVDFPESTLSYNLIPGSPPTRIPIPTTTESCEHNFCFMTTIPLRICKAITTYKSQGITVGHGYLWERVVVWLATGKQRRTPGAELVDFSRATDSEMMAIGNPLHELDRMGILKIGQGKASDMRRDFENKMKVTAEKSQIYHNNKIKQIDPVDLKTFRGGCL